VGRRNDQGEYVADIFREVDEDVRREHYAKLWKKYGHFVIAAAVVLVAAVGGFKAWQAWDLQLRQERSDRYAAAMALEPSDRRQAALAELAEPSGGSYGLLAAMEQARLLAEAGDTSGAVAIWDQVAASKQAGPAYQGAATVLSVLHQIDGGDLGALDARLEPLKDSTSVYRPLALELSAAIALARGDKELARSRYGELSEDAGVSAQQRSRARQVLDALDD